MSGRAGASTPGLASLRAVGATGARIFLLRSAAIWGLAALVLVVADPHAPGGSLWNDPWLHDVGRYVDVWGRWDGDWFVRIASQGYGSSHDTPAFQPLYPLLLAGAGRILGGHYIVAGILVSLAAGTVAFALLGRLVFALRGERVARRTLLYVALFPASLFLGAVYSESLFLLLAVATFLLLERGRIAWAAVACGLALLTRPTAVALLPPLLLVAWRAGDRRRAVATTLLAPALYAVYPLWLWIRVGSPLASLHAERSWHRPFSLTGLYDAVRAPLHDVAAGQRHDALLNLEGLGYLVLFLVLAIAAWRLLGATYGLFAATSLAVPVLTPAAGYPLMSLPRFMLVVFPLFVALALLASTPRRHRTVVVAFGALLVISVVRWTLYHWVA